VAGQLLPRKERANGQRSEDLVHDMKATLLALAVGLLGISALVTPALAAEHPTETRVDLYDRSSNRTGSAIINEQSGRVDFYDTKSNRTGYGTIDRGGRIDRYDTKGNRAGSGQVAPEARPRGRR
jgi:hypothetical protein